MNSSTQGAAPTATLQEPTGPSAELAIGLESLLCGDTAHRYVGEANAATLAAAEAIATAAGPSTGCTPDQLAEAITQVDLERPLGSVESALTEATGLYTRDAVYFHHSGYAAHLNCPVAIPAVAAEALVTSLNTSMDTWDQSAGATLIERRLIDWATGLAGLGATADGIFTSGGTQSNLQALLIARYRAAASRSGSLPQRLQGLRIYTSAESHFSVSRSASMLGLGDEAVVPVPVDTGHRMDPGELARLLAEGQAAGHQAMAIVATAGTTDFGAIDPLRDVAGLARSYGAWFHVDAAYGCGLLVSLRHRDLLAGIESADSVTVDFHKSFFQPIGSSALLLRDGSAFGHITHHAEYLNPAREAGQVPNQIEKSLQTTRRFDALKLWITVRSIGSRPLGALFDEVMDRARAAARTVQATDRLLLAAEPRLSTVVYRYVPPADSNLTAEQADRLNDDIRAACYASGAAMVAATTVDGRRHLKLTLLNPRTSEDQIASIIAVTRAHGDALLAHATRTPTGGTR